MSADQNSQPLTIRSSDFDHFYRLEAHSVFRALAVTLRQRDLAEEATAEALARCFQHWARVSTLDNPAGWCYRVGLNWAISRLRRRRFTPLRREPDVEEPSIFDPSLEQALLRLDVGQRSVVVLRYLWDLSQEEVARVLEIPVGTVKSRLGRALATLRDELEER